METIEFKVIVPEGYEIDKENSTFECIKFKKNEKWRDQKFQKIDGFQINNFSDIILVKGKNEPIYYNLFATRKQAESALAMARISQIMANDKRFGGTITEEEWSTKDSKFCISRLNNRFIINTWTHDYHFLAFHTTSQAELFLEENKDLVKQYYMN